MSIISRKVEPKEARNWFFALTASTATVAPGRHALRAYNTLVWKTIEFDVVEGQDVTFQIVNRPGRFTYVLVTLLGVGPIYVDIERA